jgi:ATP-GRASP peptide maturase of grasp-with-spasm system
MILILSQAQSEFNTELVIDWLSSLNASYHILTGDELFDTTKMQFSLNQHTQELFIQDEQGKLNNKEIGIVWFRRQVSKAIFESYEHLNYYPESKRALINYLIKEFQLFYSVLSFSFNDLPWLNRPETSNLNKIQVLIAAKKCGLEIPATIVSNSIGPHLNDFNQQYITKSLTDCATIKEDDEKYYSMLSCLVDNRNIAREAFIFPSLLQNYIEKEFEVRTFYLDGKCKSIAIFSQSDKQTQIDFRNYNHLHPNRYVPYKLPGDIEKKLNRLMNLLQLESGSIDIIKTKNGQYVFLEVNPVGQYGWVSFYGNYNLEKDIANYLVKNDRYATKESKETCFSQTSNSREQQ